jgi:hypothetical protein
MATTSLGFTVVLSCGVALAPLLVTPDQSGATALRSRAAICEVVASDAGRPVTRGAATTLCRHAHVALEPASTEGAGAAKR